MNLKICRDVEDMLKFCTIIFWIRFSWVDKIENQRDWENVFNNSKSEFWKKEKKKEKVASKFNKSLEELERFTNVMQ